MRIVLFEHPRVASANHFNDIANTPLWSCLMTGYATASLIEAGHDAEILDASGVSFEAASRMVMDSPADILAIHAIYFWESTEKLFDLVSKAKRKGQIICLFGFFPTMAWKELLEKFEAVDCIAVGEPEETLVELSDICASSGKASPLRGLAARVQGKPTLPGFRTPIDPLDRLPFPIRPFIKNEETVSILASRGCYNGCSFCLIPAFDGGNAYWRGRSIENVAEEIGTLTTRGKKDFYFADPNFIGPGKAGKERAESLASMLSGLNITFGMETRAADITEPLLRALRDAGLTSLLLGIESGNSRVLERLSKRTTVMENERAIAITRDAGIEPEIGFIMFDATSTIEDIRDNFAFLNRNKLLDRLGRTANLLYHDHIVLKGTSAYRVAAGTGRLASEGFLGVEGRLIYEDPRVEWLSGIIKPICWRILKEMSLEDSRIDWRHEITSGGYYHAVNEYLVHTFGKLLDIAEHLLNRPEVDWTTAQLAIALYELEQQLSG